jgi:hypothetical protein
VKYFKDQAIDGVTHLKEFCIYNFSLTYIYIPLAQRIQRCKADMKAEEKLARR